MSSRRSRANNLQIQAKEQPVTIEYLERAPITAKATLKKEILRPFIRGKRGR